MHHGKTLLTLLLLLCSLKVAALDLLDPDQAFGFKWQRQGPRYTLSWQIHPDYKLYPTSICIKENGKPLSLKWLTPKESHTPRVEVQPHSTTSTLTVSYQGCHQSGLCLAPEQHTLTTSSNHLWQAFLLGLLLSITPCLLPMWPVFIASLHHTAQRTQRAKTHATLAAAFITGILISYNIMAYALHVLHAPLLAWIQNPIVLSTAAILLGYLGLSMLGFMPQRIRFNPSFQAQLPSTTAYPHLNMLLLGAGGLMVLSPCLTPPLLAAMAYLPDAANIWAPATALSLGMCIPFMGLALGHQWHMRYLRKMAPVSQQLLGLFVLMTAIVLLLRILPANLAPWAWSGYAAMTLLAMAHAWRQLKQHTLWLLLPLCLSLAALWQSWPSSTPLKTQYIQSSSALQQALKLSSDQQRPTVIMVSATWCGTCTQVKAALKQALEKHPNWTYLLIDVSHPPKTAATTLIDNWGLHAPPMLLWFDQQGQPLAQYTLLGAVSKQQISTTMHAIEAK